ncbi:MAG: prephenate dehydrogenase [Candidatus Latescibacteria bacterium]|nr:prephenate dehydrogenase [Candidatus Latescibacterota bacterium]
MGLIGGSLGLALKRLGHPARLVGVSRPETIAQALELGVIDEGWDYPDLAKALDGADLVVLCTPIQRILSLLEEVGRCAAPGALITDVGSTKRRIAAQAAACLRPDLHFVGGHPMAGSEKAGVTAADPFLFQNAIYILVPGAAVPAPHYAALVQLLKEVGAKVLELDAESHDEVVAAISHLPQMMATSLVEMVGRLHEQKGYFLTLAAGGFRDLTRIASSPYAPVWEDICRTNQDQIGRMIDQYIAVLQDVRQRLADPSLGQDFAFANHTRNSIPRDAKGFIHTLFEILVVAEDKPGIIAQIAQALGQEQININDIEVMKVREGEGGTLRLGFDSEQAANHALEVLARLGYQARRR